MESNFKFKLGELVRDTITGMTGKIMARIDYVADTNQYEIQQVTLDADGQPFPKVWFTEPRLMRCAVEN